MMNKHFRRSWLAFVMLSALWTTQLNAQKFTLEGNITDTLNQGIELATLLLLKQQDSVMMGFSITNPKGRFKIDDVVPGDYILNITYLGYKDINREISISESIDFGTIQLKASGLTISDILVSASHIPIQIKHDTIQYNADAFKTRPADNVEELLRKLPGIEIDDDGTITAHGEEVENVLVEGKEFFGSDPTIATKNLPADVIDNVQLFDQKSDMAQFSGIDDGERQKTINLVLKEGKKAGYFGNAELGYGSEERVDGKFNINRFTQNTQLSSIGMFNNVNKQGFSFREYIDFMGGLGNLTSGGGNRRNSNDAGIPIANGLGQGFVTTGAGGLNYNVDIGKDIDINSSYFFNRIENEINQEVNRQTILESGGFNTDQIAELLNVNKNHRLNSKIEVKLDSTQRLITRISVGWNDGTSMSQSSSNNRNEGNELVSSGLYNNSSSGDQLNASMNATYMKRYKKSGRFFSTNVRLGYSDKSELGDLNSTNTIRRNNQDIATTLLQQQSQDNLQSNYFVKLSLTEPLGGRRYVEVNGSRSNFKNDFDKDFYDLVGTGSNTQAIINEQLSNSYKRNYSYNRIGLNIKFNKNQSSLTTGLSVQHSDLNGELRDEGVMINQDYLYLLPSLNYNKDISASRSLRIRYSTNIREPSLDQLQPIVDNSDPLNIYIGNPNLQPSYRHNVSLNYNSYSQFSSIGFFSRANLTYTKNSITNTKTVDEFFIQTTMPINTDYAFNSSLYANITAPLKFIKHRINLSNTISYSENILFINGDMDKARRTTDRIRLSLDNWKKDLVDLEYGARVNLNSTAYSESSTLNQSYVNMEYFVNLDFDIEHDWNIGTDFRHNTYSDEDFGDQISLTRWSASISKVFLASKKLRAEIAVTDILDQNQNINRTSNLNYIQDERIESIGRYFMLSLSYSFSGFGNNQQRTGGGGRRGRGR